MMIDYKYSKINDGFWKAKQKNNREITSYAIWDRFQETGRISAFEFDWEEGKENKPHIFWDSDVAKWIEAAAYILYHEKAPDLAERVESLIDKIEQNQGDDGYFNIFFTVCEPGKRFQGRTNHELYCAGHLIEAAVAYFEATGRRRFLSCMEKYVDYIYKVFVEEESAGFITPGHEEIELALIRLYRCTGEKRHLELARFFIDARGVQQEDSYPYALPEYSQSHIPVRKQNTAVGHSVRACYLYTGMAMLAKELGDQELFAACRDIFTDIICRKMFITGGIGSTHLGEAFTVAYDLPNDVAYNETCASIAMCLFARAMQEIDHDTVYADIIEKELYNGVLAGLSLDGRAFFYENPLEINRRNYVRNSSTKDKERYPITQRKAVFETSCCPPNINRTFASIQRYIYGLERDTVYIHQFISSELSVDDMVVNMETNYPNDGTIRIDAKNVPVLMIRIPGWCDSFTVNQTYQVQDGYIRLEQPAEVMIVFEMKPIIIEANPLVYRNVGKVAVQYGPIVYCMESIDNGPNIYSLYLDVNAGFTVAYNEAFNLNVLKTCGWQKPCSNRLYQPVSDVYNPADITLIPYSCHANRGQTDMLVWIHYKNK